jgi:hypothetical protein
MLPATILHAYYYRYKVRMLKAGILNGAKRVQADPLENVSKAEKMRQVYCVTKRKFFCMVTKAELERELFLFDGTDQQDVQSKEKFHEILQCKLRTVAASLAVSVPLLSNFEILQDHFQWLCDGSIKETVQRKLEKELRLMEQYLLSLGQESLTSIIKSYASDCNLHVDGSGSTYHWVGILRAAERHWRTTEDFALFRTELEGVSGTGPQLVFKIQDR